MKFQRSESDDWRSQKHNICALLFEVHKYDDYIVAQEIVVGQRSEVTSGVTERSCLLLWRSRQENSCRVEHVPPILD